jgi:hypothetical protein
MGGSSPVSDFHADTRATASTFASDFEALFLVYAVAYLEIVRQVTVQSAPRGEFMLRIWHAVCRLVAGMLANVEQELEQQDERTKRSFQDGYTKGKLEGSSSSSQWKARHNAVVRFPAIFLISISYFFSNTT